MWYYLVMIQVSISEAKAHFSGLLAKVEDGHEIVICSRGSPVAKLIPAAPKPKKRVLGKGLLGLKEIPESFFEPMTEEELAEWERPIEL